MHFGKLGRRFCRLSALLVQLLDQAFLTSARQPGVDAHLLLCPCSFPLLADRLLVRLAFEQNAALIRERVDSYPLVFNFLVALAYLLLKLEDFAFEIVLLGDGLCQGSPRRDRV